MLSALKNKLNRKYSKYSKIYIEFRKICLRQALYKNRYKCGVAAKFKFRGLYSEVEFI